MVKEYKIEKGNFVTWDEAHFGKFSQKYLNRTFYFDVHPPCGKMLTALSGYLFNQTDAFKFTSSDAFPDTFDYVGMRRMHAFMASLVPLFAFLIFRRLGMSLRRSMLCSMLFIFDNGLTSIGRLILLDPHLIAFTAATTYALACLATKKKEKNHPKPTKALYNKEKNSCETNDPPVTNRNPTTTTSSQPSAIKNTLHAYPSINKLNAGILGCLLGCIISIKWIGCLTMLFVGIYIIYDLYMKLKYCKMSRLVQDFLLYAFYLIVIPTSIYIGLFYVHFKIVNRSGDDDGHISTNFQLSLKNNNFSKTRMYISYGKQVTIKSAVGYLHSHRHVYGDDGVTDDMADDLNALRQVTTYSAKDSNNNFYFQKVTDDKDTSFLTNADSIVIKHDETNGYLEPDNKRAYYSKGRRVVNRRGAPERKSTWVVEAISDSLKLEPQIKAISTSFYLKNVEYECYLCASDKKYPGWGYNQGEIYCSMDRKSATAWHVEENLWAEEQNNPLYTSLKSSFISNLIEHNIAMYKTNKSFTQEEDLEPPSIVSSPEEWPLLRRGLRMSQWGDNHKFYMFMNPLLLYSSTISIIILPFYYFYSIIRSNRKAYSYKKNKKLFKSEFAELSNETLQLTDSVQRRTASNSDRKKTSKPDDKVEGFFTYLIFGGWSIHYIAFFFVGRVLYLHHYFPAYFFALLSICYFLRFLHIKFVVLFVSLAILIYFCYSPLTYGFLSADNVRYLKLVPSWDFVE